MPHIDTDNEIPGIRGLMTYRPESGAILSELAQQLLRGESDLTPFERELIAVRVSRGNECRYCEQSHAAAARALNHGDGDGVVDDVADHGGESEFVDARMQALLAIADCVRADARTVTPELVAAAKDAGASEQAIHDAVLVAAAFNMFNRYVDGLGAITPVGREAYEPIGEVLATAGYVR